MCDKQGGLEQHGPYDHFWATTAEAIHFGLGWTNIIPWLGPTNGVPGH
jgi:hypothetical protein